VLVLVIVVTVLSSSDLMPKALQRDLFDPYRLKTIPVLLVWVLTQIQLWTGNRSGSAPLQAPGSVHAAPAT
jgi:hypothetical protein